MKYSPSDTKKIFSLPLVFLFMLACQLTAPKETTSQQAVAQNRVRAPPAQACRVSTGFADGALNLRTCGGTHCPIVDVLREGDLLRQNLPHPIEGWISVKTTGGLSGWVNSKYCKGE